MTPKVWEEHGPLQKHQAKFNDATYTRAAREHLDGNHLRPRPSRLTDGNARIWVQDDYRLNNTKQRHDSKAETTPGLVLRPSARSHVPLNSPSTGLQTAQGPTELVWNSTSKHFAHSYSAGPSRPQDEYPTSLPSPRSPPNAALLDPFSSTLVPLDRAKSFMVKFCTSG